MATVYPETPNPPGAERPPERSLDRPSTHILAIASLILSVLGLLPVMPVVGSIAGIITGRIAQREIRTRPDLYSGEGTARAGVILGWIGLILGLLAICLVLAGMLFFIPTGSVIQTMPSPLIETIPVPLP